MNLSEEEINWPKNTFAELIAGNSPYAFYLFQWVDYKNEAKHYRLKLMHDVKLFDGTIVEDCYPNADSFHGKVLVKDNDVEFIRISKKQFGRTWKHPSEQDKND